MLSTPNLLIIIPIFKASYNYLKAEAACFAGI